MLIIFSLIITLLLVIFLSGPRLKVNTTINPILLPEDLDGYLLKNENAVKNLLPDVEKKIIWANGKKEKTEYSIIYFHGFTTSRQEISPVTEILGKKIGANIFFTRLKEHGIDDVDALGRATINDWINDAWEAYKIAKRIGSKIILLSMSGGSPLALWLCQNQEKPGDIVANVLLSPMFEPHDPTAGVLLLPWGKKLIELVIGKYREVQPYKEEHRKLMTCKYPAKTLITMMGLCKLSWMLDLKSLQVPTLCMYNPNDNIVSIPRMKTEMKKVRNSVKKIIPVAARHHCIAGDAISPEMNDFVVEEIMQFLSERLGIKKERVITMQDNNGFFKTKQYEIYYRWMTAHPDSDTAFILFHGISMHGKYIENLYDKELKAHYIGIDYPGKGQSSGRRGSAKMLKVFVPLFDEIVAELSEKGIKKIILVGESYGSALSYYTAHKSKYADLIKGLIFIPGIYSDKRFENPGNKLLLNIGYHLFPNLYVTKGPYNPEGATNVNANIRKLDEDTLIEPRGSVAYVNSLAHFIEFMNKTIENNKIPLLIFHGSQDLYTTDEIVKTFFEKIRSPKLLQISKNSKHLLLHSAELESFKVKIKEWVNEIL